MEPEIVIGDAGAGDAAAIAAVHAESWRATYRGILGDTYLDGPIEAERERLWRARFTETPPPLVVVARDGAAVVGFACAFPDKDPRWGALIDNLHVLPSHKRRRLATRLMEALARRIAAVSPAAPLYLWAYEVNRAARATYESLGGRRVERAPRTGADGTSAPAIRYTWPSPKAIAAARPVNREEV